MMPISKRYFVFSAHTLDEFVVSCDVLESGVTNSFSADEGSHFLCVLAVAEYPALAHYDWVDVGIHLSIDKRDVINQVYAPIPDSFDRGWAAAEHSWEKRRKRRLLIM